MAARRSNRQKYGDFWRALRYLRPYRPDVAASIACALLAAVLLTVTLYTAAPVMKVVIEGETVAGWVEDRLAEDRLDAALVRDSGGLRVARVEEGGPADRIGLEPGTLVNDLGPLLADAPPAKWHLRQLRRVAGLLPQDPVETVAALVGIIVVLAALGHAFRFIQEYFGERASVAATNDFRRDLYGRVLRLPMAYFGQFGTSDVTSRLTADALGVQIGLKTMLGRGVQEPLNATAALALALWLDWRLTAFIVVFVPVTFVLMRKLGKKVGRAARKELTHNATMLGQIEASLDGVRVVKAAAAEDFERRRYGRIMDQLQRQQLKAAKYDAATGPVLEILATAAVGGVAVFAAYLVRVQGTLDATTFILILACLAAIGEALRKLSKLNNVLQRANAGAARMFEAAELPAEGQPQTRDPERDDRPTARHDREGVRPRQRQLRHRRDTEPAAPAALPHGRASPSAALGVEGGGSAGSTATSAGATSDFRTISFDDVSFAYPGTDVAAVDGVSLTVRRGQAVAVVGRNGSGKTTLLALLPRFFDPDAGRITIDGTDVRDLPLAELRRHVGVVTQEGALFPGTVAQNIAYGQDEPDLARVEAAARRAYAHDFITARGGYGTELTGQGGGLSGGQRQRLNIARAIYRDSPILILDEATSQVDAESEHLIQKALDELMGDRTTFVIAHRFSTITKADVIVVMDAGRVVGQGGHAELMDICPTYRNLYDRQLTAA